MGTLVKDARGRSQFWYYAYRDANGRRLKKSTKETDRRKAKMIGEAFESAEDLAKHGNATEEQIRRVINDVLARVTGKTSYDPTVRQWFERWLETEKGAISEGTRIRYKQIVKDSWLVSGRWPIFALRTSRPRTCSNIANNSKRAVGHL
jgi:hypothetical protein